MSGAYQDIPRAYSAAAECAACFLAVLLFPRRKKRLIALYTPAFFAAQTILLVTTDDVPLAWWLPVMLTAILCMYAYLRLCCRATRLFTGYATATAFLQAELVASLEWQLRCYLANTFGMAGAWELPLLIAVYGALFAAFFAFSRTALARAAIEISWKELLFIIVIASLAFLFSNLSFITNKLPFTSVYRQEIFTIRTLSDLVGLVVLYSYHNRMGEVKLKAELESMQAVLDSQYQNFLTYKESIDVINIKYHDLKHQVQALRQEEDPAKRKEWIDSLEKELELYNISFNTGNKVLDTILATKELQCRKHGIGITFIVNSGPLRLMADSDICSLFANALDNAIEAECKIIDPEKRLIRLEVSERRRFLFIQCENYFADGLRLQNGIPLTSKEDKARHGFGVKSIIYTAKKYGGNTILEQKDNWFHIKILIPLQA